jgi:hypothetical protein
MSKKGRKKDPVTRRPSAIEAAWQNVKAQVDGLSRLSAEERSILRKQTAAQAKDDYEALVKILDDRLSQMDHLPALALLTSRFLMQPVPAPHAEITEEPILLSHLEILQAFYLHQPPARKVPTVGEGCGREEVIQFVDGLNELCDLLPRLQTAFYAKRLDTFSADPSLSWLSDQVRIHTQAVRYWGFPAEVLRISREVLIRCDNRAIRELGDPLSPVISGLAGALALVEQRLEGYKESLRKLLCATSVQDLKLACSLQFPDAHNLTHRQMHAIIDASRSLEDAKEHLIWCLDMRVRPTQFTFSLDDLHALFGSRFSLSDMRSLLARISIGHGDLSSEEVGRFFLSNPIRARPIIKMSDEKYALMIPNLVYAFPLEIVRSIISDNEQLFEAYSRARSDFLEEEAARVIGGAFPGATIWRGSRYKDEVGDGEWSGPRFERTGGIA